MDRGRREVLASALTVIAILAGVLPGAQAGLDDRFLGTPEGLDAYRGDLHAHTAFSDGEGRPSDAFAQAKTAGLDFFAVTDHAEWLLFPFRADTDCINPDALDCKATPLPSKLEWTATGEAAQAATDAGFVGLRGFEWSSPAEGHVNVLGTSLWTDTIQTGPSPMTPFYGWLMAQTDDPDRIGAFNHPGREPLMFDQFAYHPPVDAHMGTIEAFNRDDAYTDEVLDALDAGWHLGVIGTSDAHGPEGWTQDDAGRTVLLAPELSREAVLTAVAEQRTIGTIGDDIDARFSVDGTLFGGEVDASTDETLFADYHLKDFGGEPFLRIDLLGPGGYQQTKATIGQAETNGFFTVDLSEVPSTLTGERYIVLRAWQGGQPTLMTSPIWITPS